MGNGHCLRSDWWWEQHSQWNQRPTRGANHAGVANSTDGTTGEIDAGANETWYVKPHWDAARHYSLVMSFVGVFCLCDIFWCLILIFPSSDSATFVWLWPVALELRERMELRLLLTDFSIVVVIFQFHNFAIFRQGF